MEQVSGPLVPLRISNYYKTPRPHPWRPTMGYENVEVVPLYVLTFYDGDHSSNCMYRQFVEELFIILKQNYKY